MNLIFISPIMPLSDLVKEQAGRLLNGVFAE